MLTLHVRLKFWLQRPIGEITLNPSTAFPAAVVPFLRQGASAFIVSAMFTWPYPIIVVTNNTLDINARLCGAFW